MLVSRRHRVVDHVRHGHLIAQVELAVGVIGRSVEGHLGAPRVGGRSRDEPSGVGLEIQREAPREPPARQANGERKKVGYVMARRVPRSVNGVESKRYFAASVKSWTPCMPCRVP